MSAIQPTPEQLEAFLTRDMTQPIAMLNLLKFKDKATYPEGTPEAGENLSGMEAYMRYGAGLPPIFETIGARLLYNGPVQSFMIGEGDYDAAALVRYPSREAFLSMTASEAYQAIHPHRDAGLAHQLLIETLPMD